jgi:hypothetical protein
MEDTLVMIDARPSEKISFDCVYADCAVPELVVPIVETESRPFGFIGLIRPSGSNGSGRVSETADLMRISGISILIALLGVEGSYTALVVAFSIPRTPRIPACSGCVKRFLERTTPSMMIAGSEGRYATIAAGIDTIKMVESLANPASTLTKQEETGTSLSQSVNISIEKSLDLTSSWIRILKNNLGYSGSSRELVGDGESHNPDSRLLLVLVWLGADELSEPDIW